MIDAAELVRIRMNYSLCGDTGSLFDWIRKGASVEDRHYVAMHGNWEFADVSLFHYIATLSDCDLATALTIFFSAGPEFFVENGISGDSLMGSQFFTVLMLNDIRERFYNGYYATQIFDFRLNDNIAQSIKNLRDMNGVMLEAVRNFIPDELMGYRAGIVLEDRPDWHEGFPPFISGPERNEPQGGDLES